jgi:hypothetical protein
MADTRTPPAGPVNAPAARWQAQQAAELAEFEVALAGRNPHEAEMNLPAGLEEDGAA